MESFLGKLALGFILLLAGWMLRRRAETQDVFYPAVPTSSRKSAPDDACVWCGEKFPIDYSEEVSDDDLDPIALQKCRSWVMFSYGDGETPSIMACERLHLELWLMQNHA